jgi:hypothetical protein
LKFKLSSKGLVVRILYPVLDQNFITQVSQMLEDKSPNIKRIGFDGLPRWEYRVANTSSKNDQSIRLASCSRGMLWIELIQQIGI